jgi:hypothetical protein
MHNDERRCARSRPVRPGHCQSHARSVTSAARSDLSDRFAQFVHSSKCRASNDAATIRQRRSHIPHLRRNAEQAPGARESRLQAVARNGVTFAVVTRDDRVATRERQGPPDIGPDPADVPAVPAPSRVLRDLPKPEPLEPGVDKPLHCGQYAASSSSGRGESPEHSGLWHRSLPCRSAMSAGERRATGRFKPEAPLILHAARHIEPLRRAPFSVSGFKDAEVMLHIAPRASRLPDHQPPTRAVHSVENRASVSEWSGVRNDHQAPKQSHGKMRPPADGHPVTMSLVVALSQSRKTC